MLDLKRRLGLLLPGDARGALQNVLTVEWSGHKTVLVEVPSPSGPSSSNDVEMLGMGSSGRDTSQYGRLGDEEDERAYLNRSDSPPPRDGRSSRSGSTSKTKKALTPVPERQTSSSFASNNPFYTPEDDDLAPSYQTTHSKAQTYDASRRAAAGTGFSDAPRSPPTRTWTSSTGGQGKSGNGSPWSPEGTRSPTSSTGTRSSGTTASEEDPFQ